MFRSNPFSIPLVLAKAGTQGPERHLSGYLLARE
jgi:hypothetical protein